MRFGGLSSLVCSCKDRFVGCRPPSSHSFFLFCDHRLVIKLPNTTKGALFNYPVVIDYFKNCPIPPRVIF